jgi:hypothetical protein
MTDAKTHTSAMAALDAAMTRVIAREPNMIRKTLAARTKSRHRIAMVGMASRGTPSRATLT